MRTTGRADEARSRVQGSSAYGIAVVWTLGAVAPLAIGEAAAAGSRTPTGTSPASFAPKKFRVLVGRAHDAHCLFIKYSTRGQETGWMDGCTAKAQSVSRGPEPMILPPQKFFLILICKCRPMASNQLLIAAQTLHHHNLLI